MLRFADRATRYENVRITLHHCHSATVSATVPELQHRDPKGGTATMNISDNTLTKTTAAFLVQCVVAFAVSFVAIVVGIIFLPLDPWQRLFLGISVLFLVSSTFGLAKVVRDQQEASTVRVRIDEARIERLLAEHNPLIANT